MKKRNIIIIVIFVVVLISVLFVVFNKKENKKTEYDFTNKILHYGGYIENNNFQQIYIFMKDGTYYNFTNQYDENCTLRAVKGTWKKEKKHINVNLKYAILYDGGQLVETDNMAYFGVRRKDYNLIKTKYNGVTVLDFSINKGSLGDKYMNYLRINSSTYYPIYEFDNEKDLYKKLKEVYGEVFTMLIDDSIETQQENNFE